MIQDLEIIHFDPQLRALIPDNPQIEALHTGFRFAEGPVWEHKKDRLYFTDFMELKIYTWSQTAGLEVFCQESGREIGLTLDRKGRLLGCASRLQAIRRWNPDGTDDLLRNQISGSDFHINNPNDLVVKSDGAIYFSDPYNPATCPPRSAPTNGVYRLDLEQDTLYPVIAAMERPNGLCFSPDESLFYINDTNGQTIHVYDVSADGHLTAGRLFAQLDTSYGPGAPDGMKCDRAGNVYVTGPGGIWIFSKEGKPQGILKIPEIVGNFAWGGRDWRDLYITASRTLYRVPMRAKGIPVGLA